MSEMIAWLDCLELQANHLKVPLAYASMLYMLRNYIRPRARRVEQTCSEGVGQRLRLGCCARWIRAFLKMTAFLKGRPSVSIVSGRTGHLQGWARHRCRADGPRNCHARKPAECIGEPRGEVGQPRGALIIRMFLASFCTIDNCLDTYAQYATYTCIGSRRVARVGQSSPRLADEMRLDLLLSR